MTLRLATRGSTLALWQADHVRRQLGQLSDALDIDIDIVHTTGDRITDVPLAMIGDRGLFTKEVDGAVLDGRCDFAVHSLKDVPTTLSPGLTVAAVMERDDPRDAFVPAGDWSGIADLPRGARIGTSSLRRRALLLAARDDLIVDDLRGNLDTRLEKLTTGRYDGIVVALAGLRRLGRQELAAELLGPPHWLPAAGQGALAIVARDGDTSTLDALSPLNDTATRLATEAERAFLAALEGGCQIPIGALGSVNGSRLRLHGLVASLDGRTCVSGHASGDAADAVAIGESLARQLVDQGADVILRDVRSAHASTPEPPAP